jgi:hypothetical protein
MKKVDPIRGDCTRACIASLLELDIESIPNFIEYGSKWIAHFWEFLKEQKCEHHGTGWPKSENRPNGHILSESVNIDGYVIASVPSRTFKDVGHAVIMDLNGVVVHDPNPNKAWQYINVLDSKQLNNWMLIEKINNI